MAGISLHDTFAGTAAACKKFGRRKRETRRAVQLD